MFPLKATLSLLVAFGAAGAYLYVDFAGQADATTRAQIAGRLEQAEGSLRLAWQLDAQALRAVAEGLAAAPTIAPVLQRTPESFAGPDGTVPTADEHLYQVHRLVNEELMVWREKLAAGAGRRGVPDFLAVVNGAGVGLGLGSDPAWYGPSADLGKEQPTLASALAAPTSTHLIWLHKDAPLEVAVAPIRANGEVLGAVVAGYRLTLDTARRSKDLVKADVAWFVGPRVAQSTSLSPELEAELGRTVVERKLHESMGDAEVALRGRSHAVRSARVAEGPGPVGFLVLIDQDEALARGRAPLMLIPLVIGAAALLSLALVLLFFMRWLKPFEAIEKGVMELMSDNKDYWFDVKGGGLAGRLSQNLNIMVCHLTGRPLPDDHDRPGS